MKAIVSKIQIYVDYCCMQIDGVDLKNFEGTIIKNFRNSKTYSSFQIWFQSDNIDGGNICALSKEILEEFRRYLDSCNGYELEDD